MRRSLRAGMALLAVATLSPARARAQQTAEAFLGEGTQANALRGTVGLDPALAFGVGYVRAVALDAGGVSRRLGLHGEVTAILGMSSWDFTGGASMRVRQQRGFDVLTTLDLRMKIAQNDVHTALVYGYGAALRPGWFDASWYAAVDLALRGTFAATAFHGDEYRRLVPEVADGTYLTGHLSVFTGVAGGVLLGDRVLAGARFAWRFPRTFETYAPYFLPYTLNLDAGVRF